MKKRYLLPFAALASGLLLTSCEEEVVVCPVEETVNATLIWTGDYALDGCGFMLQIDDVVYKPSNEQDIADSYKTTSLTRVEANIAYHDKKVKACMAGTEMNSLKVLSLLKK